MKIGILTFFESDNYGTVLQAYALQYYLEQQGHIAEFIHVFRDIAKEGYSFHEEKPAYSIYSKIWSRFVCLKHRNDYRKKHVSFERFRKTMLHISENYYESRKTLLEHCPEYDIYISGGDQIWNPYHKVFSYTYMWDFLPNDKRRISYGSSFGVEKISDPNVLDNMHKHLHKYEAISVRESGGLQIVKDMGLHAQHVLDPVFLAQHHWSDVMDGRHPKEKYCLIYAMSDYHSEDDEIIRAYARENGFKIVILPENRRNQNNTYVKAFALSPETFLSYIANAEAVFTNSFHGLAFSLIFRRQFALLSCATKGSISKRNRLTDMLQTLGIEYREDINSIKKEINYDLLTDKIQAMVQLSKSFLDNALETKR